MKILMINKFLHPNGGSETYIFKLGECLQANGHEVQYFGMEHEGRIVGNKVNAYTSNMDFHGGSKLGKLLYPIKTIYSSEARKKIRRVLDDFQPDVCHLNNFNYQLTPSIILEIVKWRKQMNWECRIVYTAHDYQLVCPAHLCRNANKNQNCEKCLQGNYLHCVSNKCIHGSAAKSVVGATEATVWRMAKVYRYIDAVIACSFFLKARLEKNPALAQKTIGLHNFVEGAEKKTVQKKNYVLYFGRFSVEKGTKTLLEACKMLSDVQFVFAGTGPLESEVVGPNIKNVGFQTGDALEKLIREARFSLCPSECYENCPFSVMESQMYGTPVIGAEIGGIPEIMRDGETGLLFKSGDVEDLKQKIELLWHDRRLNEQYSENCLGMEFDTVKSYMDKLLGIYTQRK